MTWTCHYAQRRWSWRMSATIPVVAFGTTSPFPIVDKAFVLFVHRADHSLLMLQVGHGHAKQTTLDSTELFAFVISAKEATPLFTLFSNNPKSRPLWLSPFLFNFALWHGQALSLGLPSQESVHYLAADNTGRINLILGRPIHPFSLHLPLDWPAASTFHQKAKSDP